MNKNEKQKSVFHCLVHKIFIYSVMVTIQSKKKVHVHIKNGQKNVKDTLYAMLHGIKHAATYYRRFSRLKNASFNLFPK